MFFFLAGVVLGGCACVILMCLMAVAKSEETEAPAPRQDLASR